MKKFICPYCNKEIEVDKPQNIANHKRWCKSNPKRNDYVLSLNKVRESLKGKPSWNSGKTHLDDSRISTKTGKPWLKGKKHTEESKKKMSEACLKSNHQRVCKETLPYICVDGSIVNLDSSYERKVAQILDQNQIRWIRPSPLKWISKDGKVHNYFPDFYLIDYNLYLDPKNEYCFKAQNEKIEFIVEHYSNVIFLHEQNLTKEFIMGLWQKG